MTINRQDLAVGVIFIVIALFFALNTFFSIFQSSLPIGTPQRMGPGFFPITLAGLLTVVGVGVILKSVRSEPLTLNDVPWRGLAVILPVPVMFGLTIRGLGLVPTTFLTAFVSAFASRRMKWPLALALAAGLTAFCTAVFHYGLRIPTPLFGSWIPGLS